jgi:multiple antibiotic resistance protein
MLAALHLIPMIFIALFPVVNPIGTALVLFGLAKNVNGQNWKNSSKKIAIYSFVLLTFFFLLGHYILEFFGIGIPVVQVSGGLVMAAIGWSTLNQEDEPAGTENDPVKVESSDEARTFYPFTFPITVGPGSLAIVLTFSAHLNRANDLIVPLEKIAAVFGIFLMSLMVYFCYANLSWIMRRVPIVVAIALSRILAFFVICIGVNISWAGCLGLLALIPK